MEMVEYKYANMHIGSDTFPYEIVEQVSDKRLKVRALDYTLTEESAAKLNESFVPGGFLGHYNNYAQEWEIKSNPSNTIVSIYLHKNGIWYHKGFRMLLSDTPERFYDYNF